MRDSELIISTQELYLGIITDFSMKISALLSLVTKTQLE